MFSSVRYFVNNDDKSDSQAGERTPVSWSGNPPHLRPPRVTISPHAADMKLGANDLFVQRYIFYEEFVKLLNML